MEGWVERLGDRIEHEIQKAAGTRLGSILGMGRPKPKAIHQSTILCQCDHWRCKGVRVETYWRKIMEQE